MLELADPLAFLLLPLPVLVRLFLTAQSAEGRALCLPERVTGELMDRARDGEAGTRFALRSGALWLAWGLLVAALAGPRDLAPVEALKVSGRDLAIVLDLSGSMVRDDFFLDGRQITRLEAVQTAGAAFARRRGGDRLALIVFGSQAYYATPFTFDNEAVARRIETSVIGISGRATNISDGLGLALKRMEQSEARTKVVILLSDGVNNAGTTNPRGVAELAARMGVRVHTIALGPKDLSTAAEGERGVVDAETLRALSRISGGESFRVKTTEDLEQVTRDLDRLEANDSSGLSAEIYREFWTWPAALSLLLCLFVVVRRTA